MKKNTSFWFAYIFVRVIPAILLLYPCVSAIVSVVHPSNSGSIPVTNAVLAALSAVTLMLLALIALLVPFSKTEKSSKILKGGAGVAAAACVVALIVGAVSLFCSHTPVPAYAQTSHVYLQVGLLYGVRIVLYACISANMWLSVKNGEANRWIRLVCVVALILYFIPQIMAIFHSLTLDRSFVRRVWILFIMFYPRMCAVYGAQSTHKKAEKEMRAAV